MFLDLLRNRRSIRQFEDKTIEQAKIDLLIEAALRSPSSRSLNPWEFVVIEDGKTIKALSLSKPHGASFMKGASLAIAVCADPAVCDVWVEDCSIAALNIHYAAADLGLGSCWVQIRMRDHSQDVSAEDYVKQLLGLRDEMTVEAIIAVGYPKEEKPGHSDSSLLYDKISYEKYGQKK